MSATTWYIADKYSDAIKTAQVVSSTEKTVTLVGGRKHYKESSYDRYYPTWKEARDYKLGVINSNIDYLRGNLAQAEGAKERLLKLVDPTTEGGVLDGSNRTTSGWIGQP